MEFLFPKQYRIMFKENNILKFMSENRTNKCNSKGAFVHRQKNKLNIQVLIVHEKKKLRRIFCFVLSNRGLTVFIFTGDEMSDSVFCRIVLCFVVLC